MIENKMKKTIKITITVILLTITVFCLIISIGFSSAFWPKQGPFHRASLVNVVYDNTIVISPYNNENIYCRYGHIVSLDEEKEIKIKIAPHALFSHSGKLYGVKTVTRTKDDETFLLDENYNAVKSFDDRIEIIIDDKAYFFVNETGNPRILRWDLSSGLRDDYSILNVKFNSFYVAEGRRIFINKFGKLFLDTIDNTKVFTSKSEDKYPYKTTLFWKDKSLMIDDTEDDFELLCDEIENGYIYYSLTKNHHNNNCLAWRHEHSCICDFGISSIIKMDAETKEQEVIANLDEGSVPIRVIDDEIIYYLNGSIYKNNVLLEETYTIETGNNYYCRGSINSTTDMELKGDINYFYFDGLKTHQFALPW